MLLVDCSIFNGLLISGLSFNGLLMSGLKAAAAARCEWVRVVRHGNFIDFIVTQRMGLLKARGSAPVTVPSERQQDWHGYFI